MAVPKKKTSKSRKGMRCSHNALKKINVSFNDKTGEAHLSHNLTSRSLNYGGASFLAKKLNLSTEDPTKEESL